MSEDSSTVSAEVIPHLWLGGYAIGDVPEAQFRKNLLSYVERHDLTVVFSQWNTTGADAEALDAKLRAAKERDVDAWLGTYDLRDHTSAELATDEEKLEMDVDRLLRMVDTYASYYPDGTVFIWHEPPNTGQWTGETRADRGRSMIEHGSVIFEAQKSAVTERYPDLDLGMMLWWHHVPPSTHTAVPIVEPLMDRLGERDALPAFVYFDLYRGYYEWSGGYEAVNELVTASIEHVKAHTDGRPVYYLGQSHTVNNRYTPSKQSIVGDVRAALAAGADSYGWYLRKSYRETHPRSYDPFVPNEGEGTYREQFNTVVGSRDRFVWATQFLLEQVRGIDPAERFDLWVYGHDVDFYEHGVELRTSDGEWEFLGDVSGYLDGSDLYSGGDRGRVHAFHGLERDRFLGEGKLAVRIDADEDGDGATLRGVYAVPHLDAAHYRTEPELTTLLEETPELEPYVLGGTESDEPLRPGDELRIDVPLRTPSADLRVLVRSEQREAFERLAEYERRTDFDPRDAFDLWVCGRGLAEIGVDLSGDPIDDYGAPTEASAARVYRGLKRSAFFDRHSAGRSLVLGIEAADSSVVHAAFAMPYHGTVNFTTNAEAARVVERDYDPFAGEGQLTTFSLGYQCWPGGATLEAGDRLETRVQVYPRRLQLARE